MIPMGTYLLRRLVLVVPLLLGIGTLSFVLVHLAPGGPTILIPRTINGQVIDPRPFAHRLGLDAPLPVQYLRWLGRLVQGDLGTSLDTGVPVTSEIGDRLPATLELMGTAIGLALLLGVPLGILAAARRNALTDRFATTSSLLALSIPQFWIALVAIIVFAVDLHWLPSGNRASLTGSSGLGDALRHLVLPAGVLSLAYLGSWTLYMRSGLLDVLGQDYIRTARAKGLTPGRVLFKHGVRNALIPLVTTLGLTLPQLLGGAVVIENTFAWPGMGQLIVSAAMDRDYPVILGTTLVAGVLVILGNLLADIAYSLLDPRIRYT